MQPREFGTKRTCKSENRVQSKDESQAARIELKTRKAISICYLCGEPLRNPRDDDHVPPKQFYARSLRRKYKTTNLLTLPTHRACNNAWKLDEEYFVQSLVPFVRGSEAGDALWRHTFDKLHKGQGVALVMQVKQEFMREVGGVILPANVIAKRFDADRLHDVLWKIIRGLHFSDTQEVWPERWTLAVTITLPGQQPPDAFLAITNESLLKTRGPYPGVFAYSDHVFPDVNNLHFWAMLLWNRIIVTAAFHDPHCECEHCTFIGPVFPEPLSGTRML
ncbi:MULTISPECIES: hypothetical protein [Bradyrhizobium]|uniref:hypothetical protein n=1 Tax=Bradyrhizobium TaxID=374 RepID=UPI00155F2CD3|nr:MULTISPECIES: hypothetical protein [Bradyrhizobium]UUO28609.1 hypothetical protein DCG74_15675 [Bradyrhizobium sp. WBAH42]